MICPTCEKNNKRQRLSYVKTNRFKMKKDKDGNLVKVKKGFFRIRAFCQNCKKVI